MGEACMEECKRRGKALGCFRLIQCILRLVKVIFILVFSSSGHLFEVSHHLRLIVSRKCFS